MPRDRVAARGAACGVCGEAAVYRTPGGALRCRGHWDTAAGRTFGEPLVLGHGATPAARRAFCLRMAAWAEGRADAALHGHERAYWEGERARWHARLQAAVPALG